jgi:hypothetical protein
MFFYSIKYSVVKKAAWRPPDTDCSKKLQEEDRGEEGAETERGLCIVERCR